jgi:hypothetical protein
MASSMFAERPARGLTKESGIDSKASTTADNGRLRRYSSSARWCGESSGSSSRVGRSAVSLYAARLLGFQANSIARILEDAELCRTGGKLVATAVLQDDEAIAVSAIS